jgi:ligand-binding SRPBCC domain-containing protein
MLQWYLHHVTVISASCYSDIFNLPLAVLWTAVLGEWDREVEENTEVRVPVEKVFVHEHFHNFQHDIGKNKMLFGARTIFYIDFEKFVTQSDMAY